MAKFLDADKLMDSLTRKKSSVANQRYTEGFNDALMRFRSMLHSAPSADVVEVVHGEWLYCPETINLRSHFYCSVCNGVRLERYTKNNFRYCPNCGAKMDGERRSDNG